MSYPIRITLQLEGAVIAGLSVWAYAQTGASWTLFALLILAPDIAMLGYLAGKRIGALCYNMAHSYLAPAALAVVSLFGPDVTLPVALIWATHIGLDRAIGYGLKYASHFKDTHLGRV